MIARLRGVVAEIAEADAVLDVGGVGYVVQAGARTLSRLTEGEETVLHVESVTREDGTRLFGFSSREEKRAFVHLGAIQGVGPKAALAILDVLPPAELAEAVARDDKASVARAAGVGPKLAQRVVLELKNKTIGGGLTIASPTPGAPPSAPSNAGEAVAALMQLGTAEPVARRHVETALARLGPDAALPALIKAALQDLGR